MKLSFAAMGMLWRFSSSEGDRVTDSMLMDGASNNLTEVMEIAAELVRAGYFEKTGKHEWRIVTEKLEEHVTQ